jgi:hypothetical protein
LAAQAVCPDLRLAGGGGLALLLDHRLSEDIDLFCSSADDVEVVARALEAEGRALSVTLARVRKGPTFVRFEGHGAGAPIRVDVALSQIEIAPLPGMLAELDLDQLRLFRDELVGKLLDVAGARN